MSKYIEAKQVDVKEGFEPIEIEVYVVHNKNSYKPFVTARLTNDTTNPFVPTGDKIERYTFKINRPLLEESTPHEN